MSQSLIDDFDEKDEVQTNMDFWKFKEAKEIIGTFLRFEPDNFGEHAILNVADDEIHLPNLMALNGRLKNRVEKGNKVKIVYIGQTKAKSSGRLYEDFKVFIKK